MTKTRSADTSTPQHSGSWEHCGKGKNEKKQGFENAVWWREKTQRLVHTSHLRPCISRHKPYGIQAVSLCGLLSYNQGGIPLGEPDDGGGCHIREGRHMWQASKACSQGHCDAQTLKSFEGNTIWNYWFNFSIATLFQYLAKGTGGGGHRAHRFLKMCIFL